jgi:tetratricopeptide (TPR) repeat protein
MTTSPTAHELKAEGLRLFEEGLHEEAGAKFTEAQALFSAAEDEVEAAEMANNLGLVHRMQRRLPEALAALESARSAFARLGDRSREAQAVGNLGGLYATMGERHKALELLGQAADIFAEIDDSQRRGETLLALSAQMWKARQRGQALSTYSAGLAALERPTVGQKALRGLLAVRNRVLGG